MDDVWLVLGLLLFGSLLFCLCCYKVTNLLYMLYHIDDTEIDNLDNSPIVDEEPGGGVTTTAVASGDEIKDYRLLNNVASSTGIGCAHLYSSSTPPSITRNLYSHTFFEPGKKSASVSSLSVGVQCDVMSLSEMTSDSPYLRDSRKTLIGSTPSIHRRTEAYRSGRCSRFQSSTSSLNKSATHAAAYPFGQRELPVGGFDETDFSEQQKREASSSSYKVVEDCNFTDEGGSIPCQRHNQHQHFFSAHLLQQSNSLPPTHPSFLGANTTANHRSVPCQYSSFECIQPSVCNNRASGRTCCLAQNGPHTHHPRQYKILSKISNSINNLNHTEYRGQGNAHEPNNPTGFIIIPPPLDFCANAKFSSQRTRLSIKKREGNGSAHHHLRDEEEGEDEEEDEEEEEEDEDEEEEEEDLLLHNNQGDSSDEPHVNPYSNSPTSLC